jgi:hypothetical protein
MHNKIVMYEHFTHVHEQISTNLARCVYLHTVLAAVHKVTIKNNSMVWGGQPRQSQQAKEVGGLAVQDTTDTWRGLAVYEIAVGDGGGS